MDTNGFKHQSVLLNETTEHLLTNPDGIYLDCTLGGGGHAWALAQKLSEKALLVGLDRDEEALTAAQERLRGARCRTVFAHNNFSELDGVLTGLNIEKIDGVLFDLGVSSWQLDSPERGFSYMQDGPLDMRMDRTSSLTAKDIVNSWPQEKLARAIKLYGEERWASRIAEFIVKERDIARLTTTHQLVSVIKKAVPKGARQEGPHPAKRTFQALRIVVNDELNVLRGSFIGAVRRLNSGGKLAVISFHSLEDRIAKQTMVNLSKSCTCPPNLPVCVCGGRAVLKELKNIVPSAEEIAANSRSRSARLRIGSKT